MTSRCQLCGEPMPPGEEMFTIHGHSGPCPKQVEVEAKPLPAAEAVVQYRHREIDGEFWIDVRANGEMWAEVGPFDTAAERQRAQDDMLKMLERQQ